MTQAMEITDFEARRKIYDQVQDLIAAEIPYVFLWHEDRFAVMQKKVQGFEPYADGRYRSLKQTYLQAESN